RVHLANLHVLQLHSTSSHLEPTSSRPAHCRPPSPPTTRVGGGAVVLCLPSCARLGHALPDELLVLLRELRQDLDQRPAHGSQVSHVAEMQPGLLCAPGMHPRLLRNEPEQ